MWKSLNLCLFSRRQHVSGDRVLSEVWWVHDRGWDTRALIPLAAAIWGSSSRNPGEVPLPRGIGGWWSSRQSRFHIRATQDLKGRRAIKAQHSPISFCVQGGETQCTRPCLYMYIFTSDYITNSFNFPFARVCQQSQDSVTAFSGGQESFSQFTMDMVRQYMKDEEVRLQHQSSLLHLRQKALKEKTKTELAWLEHQKKRLRDKGEDDKMPPIRKKQRGLLMKLQQEQVRVCENKWLITFGHAVLLCVTTRVWQMTQFQSMFWIINNGFPQSLKGLIEVKWLFFNLERW